MKIVYVSSNHTQEMEFDMLHFDTCMLMKFGKGGALYLKGKKKTIELTSPLLFELVSNHAKEKKIDN